MRGPPAARHGRFAGVARFAFAPTRARLAAPLTLPAAPVPRFRILAIVLALAPLAARGDGFLTPARGARNDAMGGAAVAYPLDPSVVFTNPAGISFLRGLHVVGGSGFGIGETRFNADTGAISGKTDNGAVTLPSAYFAYAPQRVPIGFGLGYTEPFAFKLRWPGGWGGSADGVFEQITASYVTAAASVNITRQVMAGAGLHLVSASFEDLRGVGAAAASVHDATGRGASAAVSLGILFVPQPQFSVGASYLSGANVPIKGVAYGAPGMAAAPIGTFHTKLSFPPIFTLGAAVHPTANVTIEADGQVIGWAAFDQVELDYENAPAVVQSTAFANSYALRLGGEVVLARILPLRAGISYAPSPVPDSLVRAFFPDNNRLTLSAGFGVRLSKNIAFDLAYQTSTIADRRGSVAGSAGAFSFSSSFVGISLALAFEPLSNPLKPPATRL